MSTIPHFRLPLRLGADGSFDTMEQDSDEDVVQCIGVVVGTPTGTRPELPQFGVPRIEFSLAPVPLEMILGAIYTWEPRSPVIVRERLSAGEDPLTWDIGVFV